MTTQHISLVSTLFQSLHRDFASSKNDLIDALNIIEKNTKETIRNTKCKMESCIEAITGDYVTEHLPPEYSPDPCYLIEPRLLREYNELLYGLYTRANIGYQKILLKYEEERAITNKMNIELKAKIETFYTEIQTGIEEIVRGTDPKELLPTLRAHEKVHFKKCSKFKSEVDKLFQKVNKKCLNDTKDFDKYINKHIAIITKEHIDILEKYSIIKMAACKLMLTR